ncbi:hypothetical protein R1sor_017396 [Riccia sorocarpa]|uniref:DNA-directed RNA polymerase II subunit RPB9-like zinc ribbon domain-containing protein n=1 Tax=Riccia sorocarpa TaxID=122646 RepID=A0ABD3IA33_9MARC
MTESSVGFCPLCDNLLQFKEDLEKIQLWLVCKCGYKERSDSAVVFVKEFPDCVEEEEQIPITKGVLCPYCGHGEAGFFEKWIEVKPKTPRIGRESSTSSVMYVEDSGSDEEQRVTKWTKLCARKRSVSDKKFPEAFDVRLFELVLQ